MDEEEQLITQLGLLLTQVRYARRAIEDIERSTARYAGFAFATALAEGSRFGAPPLYQGALKVHIININDLAPGSGFGGFLESLLGGVGRFVGGLFGGLIGGTLSSITLPWMLYELHMVANAVERIVNRIGIGGEGADKKGKDKDKKDKEASEGPSLMAQLNILTALFEAANGDSDKAGKRADPLTPQGERWLVILRTAEALIAGIGRVVDGLILLIPLAVGALASIIFRLDSIKLAVVELLQFLLRELLLLRGVVLTVLFETIGGAARVASAVLGTLGSQPPTIVTAVFDIFSRTFDAGLAILKFIATGVSTTVDKFVRWLVDTVGAVLTALGDSKIFRVVVYLVQVLPSLLPPLVRLVRDVDVSPADKVALDEAKKLTIDVPQITGKLSDIIPPLPDLGKTLADDSELGKLRVNIGDALKGIKSDIDGVFGSTTSMLNQITGILDKAAKDESFSQKLAENEEKLKKNAGTLADTLGEAQKKAAEGTAADTGLQAIAGAYEKWLQGKGLETLLGNIGEYFKKYPKDAPRLPDLPPSTVQQPRATVEIEQVTIDVEPSTADAKEGKEGGAGPVSLVVPQLDLNQLLALFHELKERGLTLAAGSSVTQVHS